MRVSDTRIYCIDAGFILFISQNNTVELNLIHLLVLANALLEFITIFVRLYPIAVRLLINPMHQLRNTDSHHPSLRKKCQGLNACPTECV